MTEKQKFESCNTKYVMLTINIMTSKPGFPKTKYTNYQITVPFIFNTLISLFAKVTVIALVKAPGVDAL